MKNHKFVSMQHCERCFNKAMKHILNAGAHPTYFLVPSKKYKNIMKYGFTEGWFKNDE